MDPESLAGPEAAEVLAAHGAFYAAFEARDLDAMADVWEHSDDVVCAHPGWAPLHGWARVLASWDAIFRNTPYIQFVLTDVTLAMRGEIAWVSVSENILQGAEALHASAVAALNVFARRDGRWCLVVHQAGPVSPD